MTCGFSYPGTYNHECWRPAVVVAVKATKSTHSGLFYSGRCEECRTAKAGQDNVGILRFEPVAGQVNDWNGR